MSKTGIKLRLETLSGWVNQLRSNRPKVRVVRKVKR